MASKPTIGSPRWMYWVLTLAGIYNLVWGTVVILFPLSMFRIMGLPEPTYPSIWQCVGMIVGVYGVGYLIAARDPMTHYPIVLVGFLGKLFGPIGVAMTAARGELPWTFVWINLTNDLVWLIPFGIILWTAFKVRMTVPEPTPLGRTPAEAMSRATTNTGATLLDLSQKSKVMVVFLRHAGCTFCREALADLKERRDTLAEERVQLVIVHMSDDEKAGPWLESFGMDDVPRISDPTCALYRSFGLQRGSLTQLFGPKVVWRGMTAFLRGHGLGTLDGDGFQMPGVFVIRHGKIIESFKHATAGDRPDYVDIACADGTCGMSADVSPSTS
ncbi:MAG: peroxiredoxin-like family protein [Planctomycetota bacterium]